MFMLRLVTWACIGPVTGFGMYRASNVYVAVSGVGELVVLQCVLAVILQGA